MLIYDCSSDELGRVDLVFHEMLLQCRTEDCVGDGSLVTDAHCQLLLVVEFAVDLEGDLNILLMGEYISERL